MEALATIAVEIQATFTAVLVIALIVILQILDLRRAKQNHELKMRELSDSSRIAGHSATAEQKKYRLISGFSLFLQLVFGIIVLAILSCWALYLVQAGFPVSAAVSGMAAFAAILMPFIAWSVSSRKGKEMAQLIQDLDRRPRISLKSENKPAEQPVGVPEQAAAEIKETIPESAASPAPVAETAEIPVSAPVLTAPPAEAPLDCPEKIPEDSMLRRHYLAHLESLKQPKPGSVPERPTDSMLRRHYDSLMASLGRAVSKPEAMPSAPAEPVLEISAGESRQGACKERLPEDSMLRRHYLSALRSRLESGLPSCPTDSMLKRHFESWKCVFLDGELNKYLESM